MSIRPLGQFDIINQYRLAVSGQEPKGGAAPSPYYGESTAFAAGDRLELRKAARWDGLGLPKAEPKGGNALTEPNGLGDMPNEPIGGGKVSKPAVVSMPSPNRNSRNGAKIDTIVLHHTAGGGTAEDVGRFFKNPSAEVSSHYVVGKDGTIVQPVADGDRAWHAGPSVFKGRSDVNDFSLGIEIVNHGNGTDPYTDAQYVALGKLVAYMMSEYGIPMERITGHKDIAVPRGRKVDPSANFSYDRLKAEVNKHLNGKSSPAPAPAPKPAEPAPTPGGTYTVKSGDSLSKIAQKVLGDLNRWREIFELNQNQISNPNQIYPGQVLRLPGKAEAAKPEPKPEPKPTPAPATPAPVATPVVPAPVVAAPAAPTLTPEQVQAQIDAVRQQLQAIEAELTSIIAALNAQQPTS